VAAITTDLPDQEAFPLSSAVRRYILTDQEDLVRYDRDSSGFW
jgi:hypothetical protein